MAEVPLPTPTKVPVPSTDIRNAVFAGAKLDEEVTGTGDFYTDRLDVKRLTNTGRNNQFNAAQQERADQFQQFLLSSGYVFLGDYEDGPFQFSARNQYIRYDNQYYRLNATTDVGFTTTGTTAASFANDVSHFVLIDGDTLRQELASGGEGAGDALLAVKQPFPGSVLRTQHDKNAEFVSLMDVGGDRNSFDPETLELLVKAVANQLRIPYLGAQQFALPGQTLKAWRYMDGFKDRGAVASFMSVDSPDSSEPTTQVLGLSDASALGKYSDRDTVVLFAQAEGQPPLLATSNTTFTATTVTSPDFATVADKLRRKQIIDVVDATNPSNTYSGWIVAFDAATNTITVDTAWYLKGGNGVTTGTPGSGSSLKLVPNTKIWGQNTNVILKPTSDATSFAGFELGLYNNKIDGYVGYGYDVYSGGDYSALNGFQARGKLYCGFRNYSQGEYGFIGGGNQYGYYDSGSVRGLFAWNNTYGVNIKSPTSYALILQNSANEFMTGMNAVGAWQGLKFYGASTNISGTVSSYATVTTVTPTSNSDKITLPAVLTGKVLTVHNLSDTYKIYLTGPYRGGKGGISLAAGSSITLWSDGTYWYPVGGFAPASA
ncbi:hypothetical protein AZ019_000269 [Klebsiella pneumoniae]|uniref:hypothetical protein n=2 Tax=Klebsiella TaxID=570 RepID=UPI000B698BDD|nr:hypothetical protein [Klebsiella pneumoniae]MCP5658036.1 hypothetical protein [Klebsiella pneumoniae]OUH39382.1 hypothetical protein AZ019_000269 [Klebsiella pneumoniae]